MRRRNITLSLSIGLVLGVLAGVVCQDVVRDAWAKSATSTIEAQPVGATCAAIDPTQVNAAAVAANTSRSSILCQNLGTTAVMVQVGSTSGGTTGIVLAPGSAALDGLGASWSSTTTAAVYLYDLAGAGNADTHCCQATR